MPRDPSEPTGSTSAEVAPAGGPELRLDTASVHAPEGWVKEDPIASYESSASNPKGRGLVTLLDFEGLGGASDLDSIYRATVESLPSGAKPTRLPDVLLGEEQQEAIHVGYTLKGDPNSYDIVDGRPQRPLGLARTSPSSPAT